MVARRLALTLDATLSPAIDTGTASANTKSMEVE
jgi:hypothetical protein